jgi:hypothetical protein
MENEELLERIEKHFHSHNKHQHPDLNQLIRPERVKPYLIPASGLLDDSRTFSPEQEFIWDITRITAQGFSAGTVTTYYTSVGDEQLFEFTEAGTYLPGPKQVFVWDQTTRLVFQSAGLTGSAFVSIAYISVHYSKIADYLFS